MKIDDSQLAAKYERLQALMAGEPGVVAFSGGVDSAVLLAAARRVWGPSTVAVTFRHALNPPGELDTAAGVARALGVNHAVLDFDALAVEAVAHNAADRCYHCKKTMIDRLRGHAASIGCTRVLDGANADDAGLHRPGARAAAEAGVESPLQAAGLTKADVRALARLFGLANADRPAAACLATRFPYNQLLTVEALERVGLAEQRLADFGLAGTRARCHGDVLRLEAPVELMERAFGLRGELTAALTALGFGFVALDLSGYRSGAFDG